MGNRKWRNIRRKSHIRIAREALEWWLKDCIVRGRTDPDGGIPDLSTLQTELLLHQIEGAVSRGSEYYVKRK
jgi:hypothetical protein